MQAELSVATLGGATMGTTWSVKAACAPRADLHALHDVAQLALDTVVAQMSTWCDDSDISRYNRSTAGSVHALPVEFHTVLRCALEIAEASGGAYDPTLGALVDAWGFGPAQRPRRVPDAATLDAACVGVGWRRLRLEHDPPRVSQPGGIVLDLSAIAKGYGADLVAARLRAHGIASALVEVGGELYGYGRKPDDEPWRVLVEAAAEDGDAATAADAEDRAHVHVVALDGLAVATSGDRWHAFEQNDERHSHTFDPRTGRPVRHAPAGVTVIADSAMRADAWATALTVIGAEVGHAFATEHGLAARFLLRDREGLRERLTPRFVELSTVADA